MCMCFLSLGAQPKIMHSAVMDRTSCEDYSLPVNQIRVWEGFAVLSLRRLLCRAARATDAAAAARRIGYGLCEKDGPNDGVILSRVNTVKRGVFSLFKNKINSNSKKKIKSN